MISIADLQQQLGIDATFFPQFFIFIFVFLWMKFVYFSPFLTLIQKRESNSDGLAEEAQRLEEESERLEAERITAMAAANKKAADDREKVLGVSRAEGKALVDSARAAAKKKMDSARLAAAKAEEEQLAAIKGDVTPVSNLLVQKLTATKVGI